MASIPNVAALFWHVSVENEADGLGYLSEVVAADCAVVEVITENSVAREIGEVIIDDLRILEEIEDETAAVEGRVGDCDVVHGRR